MRRNSETDTINLQVANNDNVMWVESTTVVKVRRYARALGTSPAMELKQCPALPSRIYFTTAVIRDFIDCYTKL